MIAINDLRCEYLDDSIVTDEVRPRFSWRIESSVPGVRQRAYELTVINADDSWDAPALWTTGRIESSASAQIVYQGPTPRPLQRFKWRLRVWDSTGNESAWSETAFWQAGFLKNENWSGQWIAGINKNLIVPPSGQTRYELTMMTPVMHLRRGFHVHEVVKRATVFATARGVYRLSINGERVGDHELSPGWTDYKVRTHYQAYDVTDSLRMGKNAIGAELGEGWYAGYIGINMKHPAAHYGDVPELLVELHIEFSDGRVHRVVTDDLWRSARGPRMWSDMLRGEMYMSADELEGWDRPDFDDADWNGVEVRDTLGAGALLAEPSPPMRVSRFLEPQKIWKNQAGNWMIDFGEYISGVVEVTLDGTPGAVIRIMHGEWIHDDRAYMENLWSAKPIDTVVLRGGPQLYRPLFTQHGFQYVEIEGLADLSADNVRAVQFHTDNRSTGVFECSDKDLTKLAANFNRTMKANSLSTPACEVARDERMAFLGDAQLSAATAFFTRDHSAFYTKWTNDILDATQRMNGLFTNAAP